MNGRVAKKLRRYSQREFMQYVQAVQLWPFKARLEFAWYILWRKGKKHGSA
jgi:hypothetical protein